MTGVGGESLENLEVFGRVLGQFREKEGVKILRGPWDSWGHFGALAGSWGEFWVLGAIWGHFGGFLWGVLGSMEHFWRVLGQFRKFLWVVWGSSGHFWGPNS